MIIYTTTNLHLHDETFIDAVKGLSICTTNVRLHSNSNNNWRDITIDDERPNILQDEHLHNKTVIYTSDDITYTTKRSCARINGYVYNETVTYSTVHATKQLPRPVICICTTKRL